jgi:hypothetical protein
MTALVTLTKDEIRVCSQVALERWLTKQNSQDQPNYAKGKALGHLEHELLATIRANVSEYAVARLYELPWTFPWYPNDQHPKRRDHPDVGTRTEVRTLRTRDRIPVWQKDIDKNAVIVATRVTNTNFSEVEIYGWRQARDCQQPEWFEHASNAWRVPLDAFTDTNPATRLSLSVE